MIQAGAIYEAKYLSRYFYCKSSYCKNFGKFAIKEGAVLFVMVVQVKEMIKFVLN